MTSGILLGAVSANAAFAKTPEGTLPGVPAGMVFIDGKWHEFRFVKGKTPKVYDQILLCQLSGKAVGILAFRMQLDRTSDPEVTVIENPLPILTGESTLSESLLFETLYTGLFSYLMTMKPDAVTQGTRIEFTDVPEGSVHPAISFTLNRLGFEAVGGQTITLQIPKQSVIATGFKDIQIPQLHSIKIGISNHYTLSDLPQLRSMLDGIIYAGASNY